MTDKDVEDTISDFMVDLAVPQKLVGVYFLFLDDEIVYIGKSSNIQSRLMAHQKDKNFNRVAYLPVIKRDLDLIENQLICFYRPPKNKDVQTKYDFGTEFMCHSIRTRCVATGHRRE